MCGICGIIGKNARQKIELVQKMCDILAHRGPDGAGIKAGNGWVIGHRRLKVIDLSDRASQPMANEDNTCFLSYNGEIFNYSAIRTKLEASGHVFVSKSDTEVLLHGFEEEGIQFLDSVNGMFAFIFIDTRKKKAYLCRDRIGIKPLYYVIAGEEVVFASEIKALFCHPLIKPSLNENRLKELIQYRFVSGEETAFKNIKELSPGCFIEIELDEIKAQEQCYWEVNERTNDENINAGELLEELDKSVELRLISDVPVGVQLSGGLDSSIVTAIAAKKKHKGIHSYSIAFANKEYDESKWARMLSEYAGTIHHEITYTESDFLEDIAKCTYFYEEPLNHPSSVPMYRLCREGKREVTVLLTGEGADELFGGYSWHRRAWHISRVKRYLPAVGIEVLGAIAPESGRLSLLNKFYRRDIEGVDIKRMESWIDEKTMAEVMPKYCDQKIYSYEAGAVSNDILGRIMDLDLHEYLMPILQRQDRMNMMCGVEARVPFLDFNVVNISRRISPESLFEYGWGKSILRKIAKGIVPAPIINRKKIGFAVPISMWFRNKKGAGALLDWLVSERALNRKIWDVAVVSQYINKHLNGENDNNNLLWSLLSFEIWARIWLDGMNYEKLTEEILRKDEMDEQSTIFSTNTMKKMTAQKCAGQCARQNSMTSVNICHVVSSMDIGGMEKVVQTLIDKQKGTNFLCYLFCTDMEGELYRKVDVAERECGCRGGSLLGFDVVTLRKLIKFCSVNKIEIIHAHNMLGIVYGVVSAKITGIPCVVTVHGHDIYLSLFEKHLRHFLFKNSSAIVTVSKAIFDDLYEQGINHQKLYIIKNGINYNGKENIQKQVQDRKEIREMLGINDNAFVIGSCGRFRKEKEYHLLIQAFAEFIRKTPNDAKLILVGDGPEKTSLINESKKKGFEVVLGTPTGGVVGQVFFPGLQNNVYEWLSAMDVFCLSSSSEGTSITLLEAGMAGLPSVVTAVGGNTEIVRDGVTGIVVSAGDAQGFVRAFNKLSEDVDLRKRMGEAARERVSEVYSADNMVNGYLKLYRNVLGCK